MKYTAEDTDFQIQFWATLLAQLNCIEYKKCIIRENGVLV